MGGVLKSSSKKKAEKKARRAVERAEAEAKKAAEEERRKDIARAYRGRLGTVATSLNGIEENNQNGALKRKNLLGE